MKAILVPETPGQKAEVRLFNAEYSPSIEDVKALTLKGGVEMILSPQEVKELMSLPVIEISDFVEKRIWEVLLTQAA